MGGWLTLDGQPTQGVIVVREPARAVPAISTTEAVATENIMPCSGEIWIGKECWW